MLLNLYGFLDGEGTCWAGFEEQGFDSFVQTKGEYVAFPLGYPLEKLQSLLYSFWRCHD